MSVVAARPASGSTPTSRKSSCASMRIGQPVDAGGRRLRQARSSTTARSTAWAPAPARRSRCCRRRTRPATGSRSCSACRCASRSTRRSSPQHPLRVGLSMDATVDVARHRRPHARRRAAHRARRTQTDVFDQSNATADAEVRSIIAANLGRARERAPRRRRPRAAPRRPAAARRARGRLPPPAADGRAQPLTARPTRRPTSSTAVTAPAGAAAAAPRRPRAGVRAAARAARSCSARSRCRWRRS